MSVIIFQLDIIIAEGTHSTGDESKTSVFALQFFLNQFSVLPKSVNFRYQCQYLISPLNKWLGLIIRISVVHIS